MDGAEWRKEDGLLSALTEAVRGLEAVRRHRDLRNGAAGGRKCTGGDAGRDGGEEVQRGSAGGMLSAAGEEKRDGEREGDDEEERGGGDDEEERGGEQRVLGALRELSVSHSGGLTAWREALREGARMLAESPPGGSDQLHLSTTDGEVTPRSDSFANTFLSVGEDIESITDKMNAIITKLDKEIQRGSSEEASAPDAAPQETRDPKEQPQCDNNPQNSHDPLVLDCGQKQEDKDRDDHSRTTPSADGGQTSDSRSGSCECSDVGETGREVKGQGDDEEGETAKDTNVSHDKGKDTNNEWITVGLAGQRESRPDVPDACFIRAPTGVAGALRCEVADALSCLIVAASEELVSRVIRVKVRDGADVRFPVIVVVPFSARYRGNYRDVAMKVVDGGRRGSSITPVTTEGTYGGQRGSFAEVRVYSLGLFAVVSCLKRENYTVPTKGLSLKLPMDPRICLNYLPGSFTAPVMAQTRIQPIDAVLLGAVKSRSDAYHSVVSTSPLLYLTHPSSQPLRRLLTLILPCPPNPDKNRRPRAPGEERGQRTRPAGASPPWDGPTASHRRRILVASVKSKETSNELLMVLGSRDKQWSVLDKVTVRNQQNGLVSFELTENFDRLLVVRLLSALQPCHLTSLAEELEESACCQAVTVVLQRRPDDPHGVLVAAVPSRDLSWELSRLHARGYSGLPEASAEICMCEGDQLLLQFSGNITSTGSQQKACMFTISGSQTGQLDAPLERITFHSQQKNHLAVRLREVDPFGNYSSPHYKGTAVFHKVARGQLEWGGDGPAPTDPKLLGEPVCKLPLTLPKKVRAINRPIVARVKLCEEADSLSDSLLLWLSGELSKEEVALLTLSLRLRRSAAQLVKLRAGDSPSTQAFHVLATWRRGLPAATHQPKASQLAHCLAKSGRPDLARELLLRHAAVTRQGPLKQRQLKSRNHTAF